MEFIAKSPYFLMRKIKYAFMAVTPLSDDEREFLQKSKALTRYIRIWLDKGAICPFSSYSYRVVAPNVILASKASLV